MMQDAVDKLVKETEYHPSPYLPKDDDLKFIARLGEIIRIQHKAINRILWNPVCFKDDHKSDFIYQELSEKSMKVQEIAKELLE